MCAWSHCNLKIDIVNESEILENEIFETEISKIWGLFGATKSVGCWISVKTCERFKAS